MNPPVADTPPWLLPLILIGFPIFFAGMWTFVCWLISAIGGWGRLAQQFLATEPPTGQRFAWQSGRLGVSNYNMVLTIHVGPAGLHLAVMPIFRIAHPPLLIPRNQIRDARTHRLFIAESVIFEVGSPSIAKIRLPKKIFADQPIAIDAQPPPPLPQV